MFITRIDKNTSPTANEETQKVNEAWAVIDRAFKKKQEKEKKEDGKGGASGDSDDSDSYDDEDDDEYSDRSDEEDCGHPFDDEEMERFFNEMFRRRFGFGISIRIGRAPSSRECESPEQKAMREERKRLKREQERIEREKRALERKQLAEEKQRKAEEDARRVQQIRDEKEKERARVEGQARALIESMTSILMAAKAVAEPRNDESLVQSMNSLIQEVRQLLELKCSADETNLVTVDMGREKLNKLLKKCISVVSPKSATAEGQVYDADGNHNGNGNDNGSEAAKEKEEDNAPAPNSPNADASVGSDRRRSEAEEQERQKREKQKKEAALEAERQKKEGM